MKKFSKSLGYYYELSSTDNERLNNEIDCILNGIKKYCTSEMKVHALAAYFQTTTKIDDYTEKLLYDDELDIKLYSVYSALVLKNTSTVGMARSIKYILDLIDISSNISLIILNDMVIYFNVVNINGTIIHVNPFIQKVCDSNFLDYGELMDKGEVIDLSDDFFDGNFTDYYNITEVLRRV